MTDNNYNSAYGDSLNMNKPPENKPAQTTPPVYNAYGPPSQYSPANNSGIVLANQTNTNSIIALILGLASIFFSGLASIPAVILGHIALKQIKETGEQGRGFALTGLIIGYVITGLTILGILAFIFFFIISATVAVGSIPSN